MSKRKKNPAARPLSEKSDAIPSDVLGSYTGKSKNGEKPQQDADDL